MGEFLYLCLDSCKFMMEGCVGIRGVGLEEGYIGVGVRGKRIW